MTDYIKHSRDQDDARDIATATERLMAESAALLASMREAYDGLGLSTHGREILEELLGYMGDVAGGLHDFDGNAGAEARERVEELEEEAEEGALSWKEEIRRDYLATRFKR